MSRLFLNECKRSLLRPEPLTHAQGRKQSKKAEQPIDVINKFGIRPNKGVPLSEYLVFRGVSNLSIKMISEINIIKAPTMHVHFRNGSYAVLDALIDAYKDECPDWRTHQKPDHASALSRSKAKQSESRKQSLELLANCSSLREYITQKGIRAPVTYICESINMNTSVMYKWFLAERVDKIDGALEMFIYKYPHHINIKQTRCKNK